MEIESETKICEDVQAQESSDNKAQKTEFDCSLMDFSHDNDCILHENCFGYDKKDLTSMKKESVFCMCKRRFTFLFMIQFVVFRDSDSKTFVDMVMRRTFEEIYNDFLLLIHSYKIDVNLIIEKFMNGDRNYFEILETSFKKELEVFVCDNYYPVGYDLKERFTDKISLYDLNETNKEYNYSFPRANNKEISYNFEEKNYLKQKIKENFESLNDNLVWLRNLDKNLVLISLEIFNLWKSFTKFRIDICEDYSTLLKLNGIFVVPGGRFREFYYWDSYWILLGLLVSEEEGIALEIIKRFTELIRRFGYIPNGMRQYYTDRTQPPMYPSMLYELYNYTTNEEIKNYILSEGIDSAIVEYDFYMEHRSVKIKDILLNKYEVFSATPRPESFKEDLITFSNAEVSKKPFVYSNLKTAAESGWDFSTRWFGDGENIEEIDILNIIPVDLNAYLYNNERILLFLLIERKKIEDDVILSRISYNNTRREYSINKILLNNNVKIWTDYNLKTGLFTENRFYFSNITPLLFNITPPDNISAVEILDNYKKVLFSYSGGVPASEYSEGNKIKQQWDFPNTWAPLVHMLVVYLLNNDFYDLALHSAQCFMRSVISYFNKTGCFQEKYNTVDIGDSGIGGEYESQEGFGWTNGVVIWMIKTFGNDLVNNNHEESYSKVAESLKTR